MKRCPECRRDYYDNTLNFCLDDGATLVDGPASGDIKTEMLPGISHLGEAQTQLLSEGAEQTKILPQAAGTTAKISFKRSLFPFVLLFLSIAAGFLIYALFPRQEGPAAVAELVKPGAIVYWEMSEGEQTAFVAERSQHIQGLIGDEKTNLDDDALMAIKTEINHYLKRKDSLSQKQFEEGLRAVYGRGTQYAPLIIRAYEKNNVPPGLGLYQAMVESEFHDCPPRLGPNHGPVGMFQFSPSTAEDYGLTPADYCNVEKQADAAARHMSDLSSDFGEGNADASLGLLSYMYGGESVRERLRQLRRRGITERSFWAIFRNRSSLQPPLDYVPPHLLPHPVSMQPQSLSYVPRFFAAAIIGETPERFELSTPPLSTVSK